MHALHHAKKAPMRASLTLVTKYIERSPPFPSPSSTLQLDIPPFSFLHISFKYPFPQPLSYTSHCSMPPPPLYPDPISSFHHIFHSTNPHQSFLPSSVSSSSIFTFSFPPRTRIPSSLALSILYSIHQTSRAIIRMMCARKLYLH